MKRRRAPNDRPNAIRFIDVLIKRGTPEDEDEATKVAERWYEQTKEYKFREYVDTIRVKKLRRRVSSLKMQQDRAEATEATREECKSAIRDLMKAEVLSLQGQVAAYPTDLVRKFRLGELMFRVGKYDEAIGLLQEAKSDPGNRAKVNYFLGLSFQKIGYNDEAIETLRQAISALQAGDADTEMTLKYALMEALMARGAEQNTMADVDEAYKLCSTIAIQNINFKEIRTKRDEIKATCWGRSRVVAGVGGAERGGEAWARWWRSFRRDWARRDCRGRCCSIARDGR